MRALFEKQGKSSNRTAPGNRGGVFAKGKGMKKVHVNPAQQPEQPGSTTEQDRLLRLERLLASFKTEQPAHTQLVSAFTPVFLMRERLIPADAPEAGQSAAPCNPRLSCLWIQPKRMPLPCLCWMLWLWAFPRLRDNGRPCAVPCRLTTSWRRACALP